MVQDRLDLRREQFVDRRDVALDRRAKACSTPRQERLQPLAVPERQRLGGILAGEEAGEIALARLIRFEQGFGQPKPQRPRGGVGVLPLAWGGGRIRPPAAPPVRPKP